MAGDREMVYGGRGAKITQREKESMFFMMCIEGGRLSSLTASKITSHVSGYGDGGEHLVITRGSGMNCEGK